MFTFLSYGAGVQTTALLALLKPQHVIFADTGDEHPLTYRYLAASTLPFVHNYGGNFIAVGNHQFPRLSDQCHQQRIIPFRMSRWCTDHYKIRPIRQWLKEHKHLPATRILGIGPEESHRQRPSETTDCSNIFPLIEKQLDREHCRQLILAAGLPIPPKSGCWLCPFQPKRSWITLRKEHPDLYRKARELEINGQGFERGVYLAGDKPLAEYLASGRVAVNDDQLELAIPCACSD